MWVSKLMNRDSRARFLPHREIPCEAPILCESYSLLEFAAPRLSPVYYGLGVPAGDRAAVVLIPGFLSMDLILFELHAWLGRVGYRPYFSGMGVGSSRMSQCSCAKPSVNRRESIRRDGAGGPLDRA